MVGRETPRGCRRGCPQRERAPALPLAYHIHALAHARHNILVVSEMGAEACDCQAPRDCAGPDISLPGPEDAPTSVEAVLSVYGEREATLGSRAVALHAGYSATRSEHAVTTPEEHQRAGLTLAGFDADHAADDDPVIAALVDRIEIARQRRSAPFEPRTSRPVNEVECGQFGASPRSREELGKIPLVLGEDVDREPCGLVNRLTGSRFLAHAEQHQGRLE